MKNRFYFTLIAVFISFCCNAQPPKTYAEQQREKANKAYNEAYIENTKKNNNKPATSNGGTAPNAGAELKAQFDKNKGSGPAPAPVQQGKLSGGGIIAGQKSWEETLRDQQKEKDLSKRQTNMRQRFQDAGFTITEAVNLGFGYQDFIEKRDFKAGVTACYEGAEAACKQFNLLKNSGQFAELKKMVDKLAVGGFTGMKAYQFLAERFPEKKEECEKAEFVAISNFYGGNKTIDTESQYTLAKPEIKALMQKRVFELYDKYGNAALASCLGNWRDYSAVSEKLEAAVAAGNTADQIKYAEIGMYIPYKSFWIYSSERYYRLLRDIPNYFTDKPLTYWQELSSWQGIGSMTVIQAASGSGYYNLHVLRENDGKFKNGINDIFKKSYLKIMLALADAGDASALNTKAVLTASGLIKKEDKEDAYKYLYAAADKGDIYAYVNILYSPGWGIKNAPSAEESMKKFMAFVAKADRDQLYELYRAIDQTKTGKNEAAQMDIAKLLCKEAARQGHEHAKRVVENMNW